MRKIQILGLFILVFVGPGWLSGQMQFSGNLYPSGMFRISDQSELSLPFRLGELNLAYTLGSIDFNTSTAIEYRWSTGESSFEMREAYLAWYPAFAEISIGKQIIAWGAVDGNNPTDNVNPYNYYYMFLPGADRKIGVMMGRINLSIGDWQLETVFIPEHTGNILPFNEPDFPIAPPEPVHYTDLNRSYEYAFKLQTYLGQGDISLSYLNGYDRGFSLLGNNPLPPDVSCTISENPFGSFVFGYRKTEVLGLDYVGFIDALTIRTEVGWFKTKTENINAIIPLETDAEYLQYVVQLEYAGPFDIIFNGQYIGSQVLKAKGQTMEITAPEGPSELTKENFQPGMGTPFAMFTENGMLLSAMNNLYDNRVEITLSSFLDLDSNGKMVGASLSYSPIENWNLELAFTKLMGDEGTKFHELEDFSHVSLGLKYSF